MARVFAEEDVQTTIEDLCGRCKLQIGLLTGQVSPASTPLYTIGLPSIIVLPFAEFSAEKLRSNCNPNNWSRQ